MVNILAKYKNGNSNVTLMSNGTRTIEFDDEMVLEQPLNIDIRVMTKCSFGLNPKTGKAFCSFCHEAARTDGDECNYNILKSKLVNLIPGIELAIGANEVSESLIDFLKWGKEKGFICNLTVNQGHLTRDFDKLMYLINNNIIFGLGVSYRSSLQWNVPEEIINYPNTVFHVIAGIDSFEDVMGLKTRGVNKLLTLGEKDFGFNLGNVDLTRIEHKQWYWWVGKLFDVFEVVSFDNLALEQLNLRRFFNQYSWDRFNNMEKSMYINAVDGYFAPSSRDNNIKSWNDININEYFKTLENEN